MSRQNKLSGTEYLTYQGETYGMSNPKTVRWGVIGTGWFGEVHVETLSDMPGIVVEAISTRRPERLKEVGDCYNVAKRYTDYHDLLADPAVDVVGVTTHIAEHRDITIDALRSGKHVFLEKPMASTVADCDRILDAAREAKGFFMVGHICRFDPRVVLAKQAIDEGKIGKIISMHARRNLSKMIGRQVLDKISALMGDGIHDGDLMLWFSGAKPVSVYAQEIHPGTNKYPDGGWAMARLDNGAIAVIESIWHLPETTPYQIDARMEIIGTEGALYINCGEAGLEIHDTTSNRRPDTLYWPHLYGKRFGILRSELRYFADCVAEGRHPSRITPEESRNAVALLAAADESSRTGKLITF
jgi:UDP-N-acetylglucosamine 3-dehydrogenase